MDIRDDIRVIDAVSPFWFLISAYRRVVDFHLVVGAPIGAPFSHERWPQNWQSRLPLVAEELSEVTSACAANDLRALADACTDTLYAVIGTAVVYGQADFADYVDAQFGGRGPDAERPEGPSKEPIDHITVGYALAPSLDVGVTARNWGYRLGQINAAWADALVAAHSGMIRHLAVALAKVAAEVVQLTVDNGIPPEPMFAEIHRSNMTKERVSGTGGKAVKGARYSPPDLDRELAEHRYRLVLVES